MTFCNNIIFLMAVFVFIKQTIYNVLINYILRCSSLAVATIYSIYSPLFAAMVFC